MLSLQFKVTQALIASAGVPTTVAHIWLCGMNSLQKSKNTIRNLKVYNAHLYLKSAIDLIFHTLEDVKKKKFCLFVMTEILEIYSLNIDKTFPTNSLNK